MKPWVGSYYKYGFLGYDERGRIQKGIKDICGKRILIIHDFIYDQKTELDTNTIIRRHLDPSNDREYGLNGYKRFERAFSGAILNQNDTVDFWNHIALYHFYGVKPNLNFYSSIFDSSEANINLEKCSKVLKLYNPDIVLLWGGVLRFAIGLNETDKTGTIESEYQDMAFDIYKKQISGKEILFVDMMSPFDIRFHTDDCHELFCNFFPTINGSNADSEPKKDYYKMALVWDKFLCICSSPICKKWTIDNFEHYVKYLWLGINGNGDYGTRRINSLKSDESIIIIDSSYRTIDGDIIYLEIQISPDGDYLRTIDIVKGVELQKFGIKPEDIPSICVPETVQITEFYLEKVISKPSKKNGPKFEGGSRGHLIIDGIDNFPLSYRLSKYSRLDIEPKKDVSSQEQLNQAITRKLQNKLKKFINELSNEKKDNLAYTILQEIYSDLLESMRMGFGMLNKGIIKPAIYYNADRKLNVAFPLFNNNGEPICVVTNRIKNREVGIIMPMTLLSMDEIRIDTWTYGDSQYDQPDWLKPGYRLPADE